MSSKKVLQQLSDAFAQRGSEGEIVGFKIKSWKGTEEELLEYQYYLKELHKAEDIELGIESDLLGDELWWIKKITQQGHMKLVGKIPMD